MLDEGGEEPPGAGEQGTLRPGAMVTSNICLARKVGDGGMGSVWIGDHLALGSEVVIKFMSTTLARDERWTTRFRREAELAARVSHPHVVQVFDHGVSRDGLPFIVMERLEGHDLGQELWERGRLSPGEVTAIVVQIAKALQRVHELGFVHRDVKPDNIFLCDLGTGEVFAKLLDFGIAKTRCDSANSLTATGITMGTPYYMSPEVLVSAKDADQGADLWALAVVAFEAITGARPFAGETIGAVALQMHSANRPRATKYVRSLPEEIDAWFARALAQATEDRFPDARSMARALAEIIPPVRTSIAPEPLDAGPTEQSVIATTTKPVEAPRARRGAALAFAVAAVALAAAMLASPNAPSTHAFDPPHHSTAGSPSAEPRRVEPSGHVALVTAKPSISITSPRPTAVKPAPKQPKRVVIKDFPDIE